MPALIDLCPQPPSACLGPSHILHRAYAGQDLTPLTASLISRALTPDPDPGAVMDLATLLMAKGGTLAEEGRRMLRQATAVQPNYRIAHGTGQGLRLLVIVTAGDFMANTPVDFLLNGSDCTLILHHVTAETQRLDLPPHDVALLAIGQSDQNAPVLANMARLLATHPGPVLNRNAGVIARLTRDQVSQVLADEPSILAPLTRRLRRGSVRMGSGPMILRPVSSHAGQGLGLVRNGAELAAWQTAHRVDEVFAAPFVDYRGADGLYAKQRVVLIGGRPYASHMALSDHWMVHYLNADMAAHPERRMAEAAWMAGFDTGFALRHARAFAALNRVFGLDYLGIDCAEVPDGRLLVFEVDTAMIVHDMDDEGLFPYKQPAMRRLFRAFQDLATRASGAA
jgi:hypothetical protein